MSPVRTSQAEPLALTQCLLHAWSTPAPGYPSTLLQHWSAQIGFSEIHKRLGGRTARELTVAPKQELDVWAVYPEALQRSLDEEVPYQSNQVEYLVDTPADSPESHSLGLLESTADGFQARAGGIREKMHIGQQLLIRSSAHTPLQLAQVEWLIVEDKETVRFGARWLPGTPQACEATLRSKLKQHPSREALMLRSKNEDQIKLWVPSLALKQGDKVTLASDSKQKLYAIRAALQMEGRPDYYLAEPLLGA
ncbi:MAG: hypothetical protein GAK45_01903 [Pseudomonas citronellolis]|nr:MAG: hypothetical protein GAK45_01903 [Pseudomonas citronellolis]